MELSFWAATDVVGSESTTRTTSSLTRSCRCSRSLTVWAAMLGRDCLADSGDRFSQRGGSTQGLAGCVRAPRGGVTTQDILAALENAAQQAGVAIFERGRRNPRSGAWHHLSALLLLASAPLSPMSATAGLYGPPEQTVQLTEDHSLSTS